MKQSLTIFCKNLILLALVLIFCGQTDVFAQMQLKGVVRDSNKQTLPGVSVRP